MAAAREDGAGARAAATLEVCGNAGVDAQGESVSAAAELSTSVGEGNAAKGPACIDAEERDPEDMEDPWNLVRLALGSLAGEPWRVKQALAWPMQAFSLRPLPEGRGWFEQLQATQTFDGFKNAMPFQPNATSNTVDLVFVGCDFEELSKFVLVDELIARLEAFLGLTVALLDKPLEIGPWAQVRTSCDGHEQFGAHLALAHLEALSAVGSTCTIGLTTMDLYPPRRFEYVTGMADAAHRVGIFSIARYVDTSTETASRKYADEDPSFGIGNVKLAQSALVAKMLARECFKLIGARECCLLECLMNPLPAGGPKAVGKLPFSLCCICLRKWQWLTQADLLDRYSTLPSFLVGWFNEECSAVWKRLHAVGVPTYAASQRKPTV